MSDCHHEPLQSVEMEDVGVTWLFGKAQVVAAREEDRQGDLQLQPRERRTDAKVQTGTKCKVGLDRA